MVDAKVSALDTLASVDRAADLLYIVDNSGGTSNKITPNSMLGFSGGNPVSTSDSQTLTNKTLDNTNTITLKDTLLTLQDNSDATKQAVFQLSGITTATTRTYTLPDATTTLVGTDATQTLTNKTLTSPTINTATVSNPTLTTDTISEHTGAAGVTVDGLLIKDGLLPAGNIQPLNLTSGTGSSWVWQNWTPTFTNLSGGTLNYAKYVQVGKTVFFRWKYTLAGAGVAGSVTFTTPTSISSGMVATNEIICADAYYTDTGTANYFGKVSWSSSTALLLLVQNSGTASLSATTLASTTPHTWANTDVISASGFYEAA
jgi:hypothetical protein